LENRDKVSSQEDYDEAARVSWEGDSLKVLRGFPEDVRKDIGAALRKLQTGDRPTNIRPMTTIGAGVFEIKATDERAWYRVIYLSKIGDTLYILHSFEKNTRATEAKDLETARLRLVQVRNRLMEVKRDEKYKARKK
jgi:phage-related protein